MFHRGRAIASFIGRVVFLRPFFPGRRRLFRRSSWCGGFELGDGGFGQVYEFFQLSFETLKFRVIRVYLQTRLYRFKLGCQYGDGLSSGSTHLKLEFLDLILQGYNVGHDGFQSKTKYINKIGDFV